MNMNPGGRLATLALVLTIGPPATTEAQDRPDLVRSDVAFLEVGRSYLIRFPEDRHPLRLKESGVMAQASQPPATASPAKSFYVATTGNDANPGTQSAPWATIRHAAKLALAGDTVHVAPGTYRENQVDFTHDGTAAAPITFISDVKWGAKFRWASSQNANHIGFNILGDYVTIQGFDVSATSNNSSMMVGIQAEGFRDRIIENRVHDFIDGDVPGAGISDSWTAPKQYTEIIGNWVYNIGTRRNARSQGIYPQNCGEVVQNNVVFNNAAWGIQAYHAATNQTISNNLVFGNKNGGILAQAAPMSDGNTGVSFDNSVISNNIVINNGGYGISNSSSALVGPNNQYLNNFVYGNASGAFQLNGNASKVMSGNITTIANPGLVNFKADGTGDYHLAAGSPLIDAGTATGAPATDFDGVKRSQGAADDIGPYEVSARRSDFHVDMFVVRKLGGGPWVLLEHPVDPKMALDIQSARSLLANKVKVAELEADPNRKDFLARRRQTASVEVKMAQTWINLAHAISISEPPTEQPRETKVNIKAK